MKSIPVNQEAIEINYLAPFCIYPKTCLLIQRAIRLNFGLCLSTCLQRHHTLVIFVFSTS